MDNTGVAVDWVRIAEIERLKADGVRLSELLIRSAAETAEAREKLAVVRTQAAGALEIAANDLEALDTGIEVTERGDRAPWALARRAIDAILEVKGA